MSFLLKSPRLAANVIGFTRHSTFPFKRKNIFLCPWRRLEINKTLARTCGLTNQKYFSKRKMRMQEPMYQKSISQIYFDIKYKGYIFIEDFKDVWHSLESSTPFTIEQTALLIQCCGHYLPLEAPSDKLMLVKKVWNKFDEIGIAKTITHYNALLDVYVELEHKFCPKNFLRNLEEQGLVPNLHTYRKLLRAQSIQGDIEKSQELLEHMKMLSESIDEAVFNTLILGCSLRGDFIGAREILELLKEKELTLSSESFLSLAQGYAKQGNFEAVKGIINEAKSKHMLFSTTQFLELAYTFATNRHPEHFSAILEMIELKKNFATVSTKVVHRLLHRNLDKEAFTLLQLREKLESVSLPHEALQMFLDHYVKFREPHEVLRIAEIFEKKGWSSIAIAYCLKETLLLKNVSHCLKFFETMKSWRYPVRIHYFYPLLIKKRKDGNDAVLGLTHIMGKYGIRPSREILKFFDQFYKFYPGAEFEDLKKLQDSGFSKKMAAWKLMDIVLTNKDVNKAFEIVSTCGIAYPGILLPVSLANAFRKCGEDAKDAKKFVHILHYLIHHIKANKITRQLPPKVRSFEYEQFLLQIAKVCSVGFNINVMKEMLKRKIPLSEIAASSMLNQFSSPEVTDLVSKLTSAELELEFDETILKRFTRGDWLQRRTYFKYDPRRYHWSLLEVAMDRNDNVHNLMLIFENLARKTEFSNDERARNIARSLFKFVSEKGDIINTERIYRIGVQKNLIKPDNYAPCVVACIVSQNLNGGVRRFHKGLKATRKCEGLDILIKEIKKKGKTSLLEDLMLSIRQIKGEIFATTKLLIELAKLGDVELTRKILQSHPQILKALFNEKCLKFFKEGNVTYFETLEKASRNTQNTSMSFLYYPLLKLYVLNGDLEKLLTLYVEVQRDDAMNTSVRRIFSNFIQNWNGEIPLKLENVLNIVRKECESKKSSQDTAETLSDEGNLKNYLKRVVQPNFGSKTESVSNINSESDILKCFCLIHSGKLNAYFKILKKKITSDGPLKAKDYLFCNELVPHMIKNPKTLDTYNELVQLCKSRDAWKKYLKLCIRLGDYQRIKQLLQNLDPEQVKVFLQDLNFEECERLCHLQLGPEMAVVYLKVINQCMNQFNLELAKKYYEKAKKQAGIDFEQCGGFVKNLKGCM